MSLKAKVEAVVYAAEEPVTLAQLAVIFADEVPLEVEEIAPQEDQIVLAGLAPEPAEAEPAVQVQVQESEVQAPEDAPAAPEQAASPESAEGAPPAVEATEGDEKKAAKLRDRKVRQQLQTVLDELIADYANGERGMEIREIAGGYRMATKPEYHDAVRGFVKSLKPPMKLSLQALETLAVIAYKQPVTAPEVSEIRGVDSGGVLGGLVSRKLITTAGRKQVIGRPILYKTTKEFLLRFGLKDVNDLPSMEEFEKMAGELAESEAEGEAQDVANSTSELPFTEAGEAATPVDHSAAEEGAPAAELAEPAAVEPHAAEESGISEHQPEELQATGQQAEEQQAAEPEGVGQETIEPDAPETEHTKPEAIEVEATEAKTTEPEAEKPLVSSGVVGEP
jgi:segregation and condensation protein B